MWHTHTDTHTNAQYFLWSENGDLTLSHIMNARKPFRLNGSKIRSQKHLRLDAFDGKSLRTRRCHDYCIILCIISEVGQNQFEWMIELVTFTQYVRWFIGFRWMRSKSPYTVITSYLVVLCSALCIRWRPSNLLIFFFFTSIRQIGLTLSRFSRTRPHKNHNCPQNQFTSLR